MIFNEMAVCYFQEWFEWFVTTDKDKIYYEDMCMILSIGTQQDYM